MSPTFERLKKKRAGSTVMPLKNEQQQQLDEQQVEQATMMADCTQFIHLVKFEKKCLFIKLVNSNAG